MAGHTARDIMDAVHRLSESYTLALADLEDVEAGRALSRTETPAARREPSSPVAELPGQSKFAEVDDTAGDADPIQKIA